MAEKADDSKEDAINYSNYINIKGYELNFKSPILKNNIYRYRCKNLKFKYFVKIDGTNLKKLLNKDKDITFMEFNQHENHKDEMKIQTNTDIILTVDDLNKFAKQIIINNINKPLQFHLDNLKNNKINWKKGKVRNLLYKIHEETFQKDEIFLSNINLIKINLSDNPEIDEENFCISKGEFINFNKNNKLERYIMLARPFQLNLYTEIKDIFIDGTFKVEPKSWYQLLNIYGYIENKNIYLPLTYVLLSSKSEKLYNKIDDFCNNLKGNYIKLRNYFYK